MNEEQVHHNMFTGSVNTDIDQLFLKEDTMVDALNMHNGHGTEYGGAENVMGTVLTNYVNLPTGRNKTIGALNDEKSQSMFYFVWNKEGNHRIIRHWSYKNYSEILARGPALNFQEFWRIHSAFFVGNDLCWTDAQPNVKGENLEGNPPRKLNINKASIQNKVFEYQIHLNLGGTTESITASDGFNYSLLNGKSFIITDGSTPVTITLSTNTIDDRAKVLEQIGAALLASQLLTKFDNNTLVVSSSFVDLEISLQDIDINTVTNPTLFEDFIRVVRHNFYHLKTEDTDEIYLTWIKPQPHISPRAKIDYSFEYNEVAIEKVRQYCVRYHFDNYERSAWGSFSNIPYSATHPTVLLKNLQYSILVDFFDEKLNNIKWLSLIRKVEIGVRYGNSQAVHSIKLLDNSEIGFRIFDFSPINPLFLSNRWVHRVNVYGIPIASDDTTSGDTQVLKLYDNIPFLAESTTVVGDENGNMTSVLTNMEYGYPNIKTDASVKIVSVNPAVTIPSITYKSYGKYRWGIVYFDDFGRCSTVQYCGEINIDSRFDYRKYYGFEIKHKAPSWATSYAIVRTSELTMEGYNNYRYFTGSGSNKITLIGINAQNPINLDSTQLTSSGTYLFDTSDVTKFNLFQKGDRLRFIYPDIDFDSEIVGYKLTVTYVGVQDENQYFITAITKTNMPILVSNNKPVVEIYTPKKTTDDIYHEIVRLPIIREKAIGEGGLHVGDRQTQSPSSPCIVSFIGGDTKWNYLKQDGRTSGEENSISYTNYEQSFERDWYFGDDKVKNEEIGRPNVIDTNARTIWDKNMIRTSDTVNSRTFYNGINAFRSLDYIHTDEIYGANRKLVVTRKNLLVIQERKTQPIYVNRSRMADFAEGQIVGRTDRLLNMSQPTVNDWGTINPESVLMVHDNAYVFDALNGIIWRYAQDGQTDLSRYGISNKVFEYAKQYGFNLSDDLKQVISGFDKQYNKIYFTFDKTTPTGSPFTIGFEDFSRETMGWKGEYSFAPECYAFIDSKLFSFVEGIMHRHNEERIDRCNFYDVQYEFELDPSVNPMWQTVKTPKAFKIQANAKFIVPSITVVNREGYPIGQESMILEPSKWQVQEGQHFAEILRDSSDNIKKFADIADANDRKSAALLQGRDLKFESMRVKLRAANPKIKNRIYRLTTQYFISAKT